MSKDLDDLESLLKDIEGASDFDLDSEKSKNDRNPILSTAKSLGGSAFSAVFPEGRRREIVTKALPDSYSQANDNFREVELGASQLYSHTKEEFAQTKREIQRRASMIAPRISKFLPFGVGKRFQAWAAEGDEPSTGMWAEDDAVDTQVQSDINEIFGNKPKQLMSIQEARARDNSELVEAAENEYKDFNRDMRTQSIEESVIRVSQQIDRLADNELITNTNFRRKSLDVNIRQLFALNDILQISKESYKRIVPAIESVVKNTALPDYAKENVGEIALALSKRRLIESVNPAEYARTFVGDTTKKIRERISEGFKGIREGMEITDFADMFEGMEDLVDEGDMADMKKKMGTDMVFELLAERYINPQRDKMLGGIKKVTSDMPLVKELGERLKYYTKNISSIYNTELTDETDDSVLKSLVSFLGETKEGFDGERLDLSDRDAETLEAPAAYNQRVYLTQTEVIPALLKSIDKGVWKLNGEERDVTYDLGQRGFTTDEEFNKRIRKQVTMPTQKKLYDAGLEKLLKDFDPEGELSEEGRAELKDYFHERVIKNRTFDIGSLADDESFQDIFTDYDDDELFRNRLDDLSTNKRFENTNKYADIFTRLRGLAGGYQREINRAALQYGDKALVDAGLFNPTGYGSVSPDDSIVSYMTNTPSNGEGIVERSSVESSTPVGEGRRVNVDALNGVISPKNGTIPPQAGFDTEKIENTLEKVLKELQNMGRIGLEAPWSARSPVGMAKSDDFDRHIAVLTAKMDESAKLGNSTDLLTTVVSLIEENNKETLRSADLLEAIKDGGIITASAEGDKAKETILSRMKGWLGKLPGKGFKLGARGTSFTASTLYSGVKRVVKSAIGGAKDVYNEEGVKLLSGVKLKAGSYYTKVNGKLKQIFKVDDIDGAVYDKEGNEVLSEEQVSNSDKLKLMRRGRLRKLSDFIGKRSKKVLESVSGFSTNRLANIKAITGEVKDYLTDLPDVYIKGEETPRLRADLIRSGHYFSNGKPVKKLKDIVGEVIDKNKKVIISEEEFTSDGFKLVDVEGKDVTNRLGKVGRRVVKNLTDIRELGTKTKDTLKGLAKGAKDTILSKFNKTKEGEEVEEGDEKESFFKRFFSKIKDTSPRGKSYDVLVKIYNLLNERMRGTPGEPIVEGAAFVVKKAKKVVKKKAESVKAKVKEELDKVTTSDKVTSLKEKVTKAYKEAKTKSKVKARKRWLKTKGKQGKRSVLEQYERNSKAAKLKAKRVKREFNRDVTNTGSIKTSIGNAFKRNIKNPINRAIEKGKDKVKERMVNLDAPTEKFKDSKVKVGSNDPNMLLLKRIADASEANWIRGITSDAEQTGDTRLKTQIYRKFSKKFRGGLSRFYNNVGKAGDDKIDEKTGETKNTEDTKEVGLVKRLLSGLGGVLSTGLGTIVTAILGKLGLSSVIGGGLTALKTTAVEGAKTLIKRGATSLATFAAGTSLTSVATTVASAVGAVISSPVAIGVAIGAGVSYLVYKQLSKVNPSWPGKVRFAQYGSRDYDNWGEDEAIKMIYLEEELKPLLKKKADGSFVISGLSKERAITLAKGYGIDEDSEKEATSFLAYLVQRFIPVYLMWNSRLNQLNISGTLQEVEARLPGPVEQLKLVNLTRLSPVHPIFAKRDDPDKADRNWLMGISDWIGFTDSTLLTGDEVSTVTANAIKALEEMVAKQAKEKKHKEIKEEATKKFNKAMTPDKDTTTVARETVKGKKALELMYKRNKGKSVEPIEDNGSTESVDVVLPTMVSTGAMSDGEWARYILMGLDIQDELDLDAMRELDALALSWINPKSATIDSKFYDLAKPHLLTLANTSTGDDEVIVSEASTWLRDRYVPMFVSWYKLMGKSVGSGAILAPKMTPAVYSITSSLIDTKMGLNGKAYPVANLPVLLDYMGDKPIIKDKMKLKSMITKVKPAKVKSSKPSVGVDDTKGKEGVVTKPLTAKEIRAKAKARDKAAVEKFNKSLGVDGFTGATMPNNSEGASLPNKGSDGTISPIASGESPISGEEGTGTYSDFVNRKIGSKSDMAVLVGDIAETQGMAPDFMIATALMESNLRANAKAGTSTAKGLYQFLDGTWNEMLKKHGNDLGIPQTAKATDPVAATLMAIKYYKENAKRLPESRRGPVDMYLSHFMGGGGANKFLKALEKNPDQSAAKVNPAAAKSNPNVFYSIDGARSVRDVYKQFYNKILTRGSNVGRLTGGKYVFRSRGGVAAEVNAKENRREEGINGKATMDLSAKQSIVNMYSDTNSPGGNRDKRKVTKPLTIDTPSLGSTGRTMAPRPSPASLRLPSEPEVIAAQKQTESVSRENPDMTKRDLSVYNRRVLQLQQNEGTQPSNGVSSAPSEITRLIESNTTQNNGVTSLLGKQLEVQDTMANLLKEISNKVTLGLEEKVKSKDIARLKREDSKPLPYEIPVDMSKSLINIGRNKTV